MSSLDFHLAQQAAAPRRRQLKDEPAWRMVLDIVISDCVLEAVSRSRRGQCDAPNTPGAEKLSTPPCTHWACPAPGSILEDLESPVMPERNPRTRE